MKLDVKCLHLMRLIRKGAATGGWAQVSAPIWPLVADLLPDDLVEKQAEPRLARLTDRGDAVLDYS